MLFIFIFLYLHPVYNAKHHIWAHQILENPLKDLKKKNPSQFRKPKQQFVYQYFTFKTLKNNLYGVCQKILLEGC